MDYILENKWTILVVLEIFVWLLTFFMLYARYWMQSRFWFRAGAILYALTGIIPQVILGIINFIDTGEIDFFTIVIVLLVIYGLTIGKDHMKRLDAYVQTLVLKKRGNS